MQAPCFSRFLVRTPKQQVRNQYAENVQLYPVFRATVRMLQCKVLFHPFE